MLSEAQRALETLARRFLPPFPNGNFSPSPPPALFDKTTDELLVIASDTVATVATDVQTRPSGKTLLRLLAWIVADARGAFMTLDKQLTETVGKRLDRQAQKVRTTLARATSDAEAARSELSTVMSASDPVSNGVDRLAEIDAKEQKADQHARDEIYVGFDYELEPLLPGYVAPSRYPELVAIHEPAGPTILPPIPPDLAAVLGPACVRRDECADPGPGGGWPQVP